MLKVIEIGNGNEIVKCTGPKGGAQFYGVRAVGSVNQPFEARHHTLRDARQAAGVKYNPPAKETAPKSSYPQYTGTSHGGNKKK